MLSSLKPCWLKCNGGHVDPTSRSFIQSLYKRWGLVKRRKTCGRKHVDMEHVNKMKRKFIEDIEAMQVEHGIPPELIINWDETQSNIIPSTDYTMAQKGATKVPLIGVDDKRAITTTISLSSVGKLLPFQLIYKGTTYQCTAKYDGLKLLGFDITYSQKRMSNEFTKLSLLKNVIKPFVDQIRDVLFNGDKSVPALLLYDYHKSNLSHKSFYEFLEQENYRYLLVPSGLTDYLQPLDLAVNKRFKYYLSNEFISWYSDQIKAELKKGKKPNEIKVDLRLSVIKEIHAKWLCTVFNKLSKDPCLTKAWDMLGLFGKKEEVSLEWNDNITMDDDVFDEIEINRTNASEQQSNDPNYHNKNHNIRPNDKQEAD